MRRILSLPKATSVLIRDEEEELLQNLLNRLSTKKLSWKEFSAKVENPLTASRLVSTKQGRTLLHLAVLDNQMEIVHALRHDRSLCLRSDIYGLNPLELAKFLDRKEILRLLQPAKEYQEDLVLPEISGFESLSHPIFETREMLELVLDLAVEAKREDKIPAEKIWMGIYFDKELGKGAYAPVSVRWIDAEMGYGVFAEKKIPSCSYIGEYTGIIQCRTSKQLKNQRYALRYPIGEGKKNFVIEAEHRGNFTRFINHSTKPNLGLQSVYWRGIPRMIFVSLKEIREGSQLTFDYGPIFWKNHSQIPQLMGPLDEI